MLRVRPISSAQTRLLVACICAAAFSALVVVVAAAEADYYKLLGVPREASQAEIKRAFRHISMKFASSPLPFKHTETQGHNTPVTTAVSTTHQGAPGQGWGPREVCAAVARVRRAERLGEAA